MAIRRRKETHDNTAGLEEDLDKYLAKNPKDEPDAFTPTPPKRRKQRGRGRSITLVFFVLILLVAAGGGGYWFALQRQSAQPVNKATTPQKASTAPAPTGTKTYTTKGEELSLSFDYPSDWTVSPASNTKTDKPITVTSPSTTITTADGSSATGKVTVTIRPGSATVDELDAHAPTIPQNSYQIAYAAPTEGQNKYPYLTFIHYDDGPKAEGAFEQVIVTGVRPFNKGELINSTALVGLDPITSAAFTKCTTQACTGSAATRLGITDATWHNATIFKQTQKIFESLKIN